MNSDRKAKADSQRRLIESLDPQWLPKHDALSQNYVDQMLDGIVNFSIPVARVETRWKLSQNRGRHEMERIAAALEQSADPIERSLAALTRKHLPE
jgi:predicted FMN-binding regulatory protein PaiB